MTPIKGCLLPLAALTFAGCGVDHSRVSRIADLTASIHVQLFNGSGLVTTPDFSCPTLDAVATLDGKALDRLEQGGTITTIASIDCVAPAWALPKPIPDEAVAEVEIHDDTGRLLFGMMHPGASRSLAWRRPASGAARWGDLVSFDWTPATDVVNYSNLRLVSHWRTIELDVQRTADYRFQDGVLTFRLPDAPPDQGPTAFDGRLEISYSQILTGVEHCEPLPFFCSASVTLPDGALTVPVSIR